MRENLARGGAQASAHTVADHGAAHFLRNREADPGCLAIFRVFPRHHQKTGAAGALRIPQRQKIPSFFDDRHGHRLGIRAISSVRGR